MPETMSLQNDLSVEEKQVYDATVKDVHSDGESSIDTITALVNEGIPTPSKLQFQHPMTNLTAPRSLPRDPTAYYVVAEVCGECSFVTADLVDLADGGREKGVTLRRSSMPCNNGTILVSVRPWLGARYHNHAHIRDSLLHHLYHHAFLHHEEPFH